MKLNGESRPLPSPVQGPVISEHELWRAHYPAGPSCPLAKKGTTHVVMENTRYKDASDRIDNTDDELATLMVNDTVSGLMSTQISSSPFENTITSGNNSNSSSLGNTIEAPLVPLAAPALIKQRKRWSREINEYILRTYFTVTNGENDVTNYRQKLLSAFNIQFPNFNTNAQILSDQLRVIIKNNLITAPQRQKIKEEVMKDLANQGNEDMLDNSTATQQQIRQDEGTNVCESVIIPANHENTQSSIQVVNDTVPSIQVENPDMHYTNEDSQMRSHMTSAKVEQVFNHFYLLYDGTSPSNRPVIPKVNTSRNICVILNYLNTDVIPKIIKDQSGVDLETIHLVVYAAALTTAKLVGVYKDETPESCNRRKQNVNPPWLIRIERQIESLRVCINRLTEFINGNKSNRLRHRVKNICKKYNTHSRFEENQEIPHRVLDTIKQKLAVIASKRKKYLLSKKRKDSNRLFRTNEKMFYRKLRAGEVEPDATHFPSRESISQYWSDIWSTPKIHNKSNAWLNSIKADSEVITHMAFDTISPALIKAVLSGMHNWRCPGPDRIQNFWLKRLHSLHIPIAHAFTQIINSQEILPTFLLQGNTYLLPKGQYTPDPAEYRPITCLCTMYKLLTACINNLIYEHLNTNKVLAEQQKGCVKNAKGCKDQLIIDSVILGQTAKQNRQLHVCYIDYKKAFDSVPHSWLLEVLEIYKINPTIINFLKLNMAHWKTKLTLRTPKTSIETSIIDIKNGIFQGDPLSAFWFCVAVNPLSQILNKTGYGYDIKANSAILHKINHLFYVDDLKLYAAKKSHLDQLAEIVSSFSDDIRMCFGLEKCRMLHINKGKIIPIQENFSVANIREMEETELYKYLGMAQNKGLDKQHIKKELEREFKGRIIAILKSQLTGKNLVKAINTFAIPVMGYSFGIIKWTDTDLHNLQRVIRTEMTKFNTHHPRACTERTTIQRRRGGRGILDIHQLHAKQVTSLRAYFHGSNSMLLQAIVRADTHITPLNLNDKNYIATSTSLAQKEDVWAGKALHGKHFQNLHGQHVDYNLSNLWLVAGQLHAETEGFICAIQDEIIHTRNYDMYIIQNPRAQPDFCRRCGEKGETLQHIISACKTLSQTQYLKRHNNVAKILHFEILRKYQPQTEPTPYYKYDPQPAIEDNNFKLYYDRTLHTHHTRTANRPDVTIVDKNNKTAYLIDFAVPLSKNMHRAYIEKIEKYSELAIEIKQLWNLEHIEILPIIISSTGLIHAKLQHNLLKLINKKLVKNTITLMQKSVLLDTCHIVRTFLQ